MKLFFDSTRMKSSIYLAYTLSLLHNLSSDLVSVEILPDSNPSELADAQCPSEFEYCRPLLTHSAELYQYKQYSKPLINWTYNEICRCMFPPHSNATKLKVIQYLHIPKTGTSFNFFLHSYFDNCSTDETHPCPHWLTNVRIYLYYTKFPHIHDMQMNYTVLRTILYHL